VINVSDGSSFFFPSPYLRCCCVSPARRCSQVFGHLTVRSVPLPLGTTAFSSFPPTFINYLFFSFPSEVRSSPPVSRGQQRPLFHSRGPSARQITCPSLRFSVGLQDLDQALPCPSRLVLTVNFFLFTSTFSPPPVSRETFPVPFDMWTHPPPARPRRHFLSPRSRSPVYIVQGGTSPTANNYQTDVFLTDLSHRGLSPSPKLQTQTSPFLGPPLFKSPLPKFPLPPLSHQGRHVHIRNFCPSSVKFSFSPFLFFFFYFPSFSFEPPRFPFLS